MLNEPTNEKLKAMRLDAMSNAWTEQGGKPDVLSDNYIAPTTTITSPHFEA
jgi:hypothetical protein